MTKQERLVPISEAAEILGVSIDTLRRWDKAGILHSERPDGKTRHFSVAELEKVKFAKPLSISDAAVQLGVSQSTLRRLEKNGIIAPDRDTNGERVYTKDTLEKFLQSEYFMRKKQVEEKILEPFKSEPTKIQESTAKEESREETPKETTPPEHFVLAEYGQEIAKNSAFRRLFAGSAVSILAISGVVIILLTVLWIAYPEEVATIFGYSKRPTPQDQNTNALVLGAKTEEQSQQQNQILAGVLRPHTAVALTIAKQIDDNLNVYARTEAQIEDFLYVDSSNNIRFTRPISVGSNELNLEDQELAENLNADLLDGHDSGTLANQLLVIDDSGNIDIEGGATFGGNINSNSITASSATFTTLDVTNFELPNDSILTSHIKNGEVKESDLANNTVTSSKISDGTIETSDISDGAVNSSKISDNTISSTDLAATLTFSSGDFLDLSTITHSTTTPQGLLLPNASSASPSSPSSGEGHIAWDTSGNQIIVYNGSSWATVSGGGSGDITAVGDILTGAAFTETTGNDGNTLYFEGTTSNSFEIALTGADPSGDITVTIPSIAGTLASLAGTQTFTGAKTFDDLTIADTDISFSGASTTFTPVGALTLNSGGTITLGDGGDAITINSSDWGISTAGALTGISGITTDGGYTQSGSSANTFTGNLNANGGLDVDDVFVIADGGAVTANTDVDYVFGGTENFAITSDLAGTVNTISLIGTPSGTAGTTRGILLQQANHATNTNGLDTAILIDNADVDLALTTAIQITNSGGGGYTNLLDTPSLDISGTGALSGATGISSSGTITFSGLTADRLVATDGSSNLASTISSANVALSVTGETGSGALVFGTSPTIASPTITTSPTAAGATWADLGTVTTIDINGGTIDGVTIGGSSAGAGTFTTLTATGDITANDAGADTILIGQSGATDDTVTIAGNISLTDDDWSISTLGATTGLTGTNTGFTAGDLSCTNCIGATEVDESTIASTSLSDTANIAYLNQSETVVNDWTFTFAGTENLDITSDLAGSVDALSIVGTPSGSVGTTRGIVVQQANHATNTNGLDTGLLIDNADADLALTTAIQITNSGGGGYTNLLDTPSIDITGAGAITGATGVSSTTGTFSGALAANGGITFDAATDTLGAFTLGGNVIGGSFILTDIGNTGTDFVATTGALTLAGVLTANGGISIAANALTGTTGVIDYTNFDVDAAGNITVAAAQGLDTNGAGALEIGKLNATSLDLCNSAACDTISIGNLATTDADTITIGDSLDTVAINSTGWNVTGAGALTVASCSGCSVNWNAIGDPTAAGAVAMAEFAQTLDWDMATDVAKTALSLTLLNDVLGSNTQYLLYLDNLDDAGANGATEALLVLDNSDANEAVVDGILFAGNSFTDFIDTPSSVFKVDGSGNVTAVSLSTPTITLSGTGTINGLDAVDATGEDTIEALIFDTDAQSVTGVWTVADSTNFRIGTGGDLTFAHDGTNSTVTSATGDLIVDNTLVTGSTIFRLGTDTTATDVQIQNNSESALFTIDGSGVATFTGNLNANGGLDVDDAFVVADGGAVSTLTISDTNVPLTGASLTLDFNNASDRTLTIANTGVGTANLTVDGTISQGGATLAATYAPISADFVTVAANGTLTGETAISALTTAISTTSTLNVDGATTLAALTLDAGSNFVMTSGTGTFAQTNAQTTDATADALTLTLSAGGTGATGALRGLVISQSDTGTTGVYDSLASIINLKTPETTTNGLFIEQNAASGTLTNAIQIAETAGTITDGILITGTLGNILNSASIDITGAGAITGATGVTSSGTITFSGLTADRLVTTTTGGALSNSITSANLALSVSDETGSGVLVFGTSPTFTTNLTLGADTVSDFTGTGIANSAGALTVDQAFSPTWTGIQTFTPSGTNDVVINGDQDSNLQLTNTLTSDATSVNSLDFSTVINALAGAATIYGVNLAQSDNTTNTGVVDAIARIQNANAAETTPAGLVIEQTGAGTLTSAIRILQTAGTITNAIDANGTLISLTELGLLDTKTTLVDIDDAVNTAITGTGALGSGSITSGFGAIDVGVDGITGGLITGTAGLTVTGAAVSLNASSNFAVSIATGTSTGAVTIGGNSNTVEINSSDWDITTTGAMTGIGAITSDGTLTVNSDATIALPAGTVDFTVSGLDADSTVTFSGLNSCDTIDTTAGGVLVCGTDATGAGGTAWSGLTAPTANLSLAHGANTTTFGWTSTGALDPWTVNFNNNSTTATTQRAMIINNAAVGTFTDLTTEALLVLDQADTTVTSNTAVTDALLITNSGGSTLTNAITIGSGTQAITTALNIASTGVTTDISLQNAETISNDTDGTIALSGDLAVNGATSADITSTTTTASLFDATVTILNLGAAATTWDIGASTGTGTVNNGLTITGALTANGAATFNTDVDLTLLETENLGITNTVSGTNAVDLVAITLTDTTTSGIQRGLVLTKAANVTDGTTEALLVLDNAETTANILTDYLLITKATTGPDTTTDAIDVSDPDLGVALRVDANSIVGTTGVIDYTNFDVDAAGNITVAAAQGLDTNGAGALEIGKLNATSLDLCNSAACDTISIGNLATTDADTITIGDSLDTVAINSTGWNVTGAGALTVASCSGCSVNWNAIGDPTAAGAVAMAEFAQTLDWVMATDVAKDGLTVTMTNALATDTTTQKAFVIANLNDAATTGTLETMMHIDNRDINETVTNGLLIEQTGAGTLTNAIQIAETTGTITDGILITGTLANILNSASIDITGAGAITGATGVSSTTGTFSGALAANGGITFDAATDTLGAFTLGGNVIGGSFILTDIGNTGTDFVATTGALTLAGVLTANGGISIAANALTGTTGVIDYTGFDVDASGNLDVLGTITAGSGNTAVTDSTGNVLHDALVDCTDTQILKWATGGGRWGCAADANSGGATALDGLTAATTDDTALLNADFTIGWDWALTTATSKGITIGESAASTGGSGDQHILRLDTASGSTAGPLEIVSTSADSGDIEFNLASAGDFEIQDASTAFATFADTGAITFTPTAGQSFTINNSAQGAADLVSVAPTWTADNTADGLAITTTYNVSASTSTVYGLNLVNADNGASTGVIDALALFSNNQATETLADGVIIRHNASSGTLTDGLQIENTTAGGTITNAINIVETAGTVTTGVNIGNNITTGISVGTGVTTAFTASSGNIVTSNEGIEFTESDTNPTCAAGDYSIYADTSETQLKKCVNGVVFDLASPDVNSFTDTTTESIVDADTTNYWDGTVPNITPSSTSAEILVMMSANITGTSATDIQIAARILRHTAAITCQTTGTAVGGVVGTFQGAALAGPTMQTIFVDAPATTSNIQYTLCSEADTETAAGTMARIDFTLFEVNDAADLAEVYPTNDSSLQSGEVVTFDPNLATGVARSTKAYDKNAIGVISTKPALVIGSRDDEGTDGKPVALSGRVPVKVKGPVKKGDILTSSSIPGTAMKATKAGPILGIAMTDYEGTDVGSVILFVKTSYFNGANLTEILQNPTEILGANLNKVALEYFINQRELNPDLVDLSEVVADRVTAGIEMITPKVTTQKLLTDSIEAATGQDITLNLSADGQFIISNEAGQKAITFDSSGNAFFSGVITADKVKANQIEGLEIFTDKISSLSEKLASLTNSATPSAVPAGTLDINKLAKKSDPELTQELVGNTGSEQVLGAQTQEQIALDAFTKATSEGSLSIDKPVEFKAKSLFASLVEFISNVIFRGDVLFEGRPTFNSDTAGVAVIKKDADNVGVVFEKEYTASPIVSVNITFDPIKLADGSIEDPKILQKRISEGGYSYFITNRDTHGFTIVLNKPSSEDLTFSWIALAVKDAKTSFSKQFSPSIATDSAILTPSLTPTLSASPTPSPSESPNPPLQTLTIKENELGFLRVRSEPSAISNEIGQVNPGQVFKIIAASEGWYKIEYTAGKTGWVSATYININ